MAPQEYLKLNKSYVGLLLIGENLSSGVRLLGNLPSHVGCAKAIGETGEKSEKGETRGKTVGSRQRAVVSPSEFPQQSPGTDQTPFEPVFP